MAGDVNKYRVDLFGHLVLEYVGLVELGSRLLLDSLGIAEFLLGELYVTLGLLALFNDISQLLIRIRLGLGCWEELLLEIVGNMGMVIKSSEIEVGGLCLSTDSAGVAGVLVLDEALHPAVIHIKNLMAVEHGTSPLLEKGSTNRATIHIR